MFATGIVSLVAFLAASGVSAQEGGLLASGFVYPNATACASRDTREATGNFGVYGDANTCYPLSTYSSTSGQPAPPAAGVEVGVIPALQSFSSCTGECPAKKVLRKRCHAESLTSRR